VLYLLSDIHGDKNFPGLKEYLSTADDRDLLIILGDTGLMYAEKENYKEFTEFFLSSRKNIAFIDGNHENFEFLNSFSSEKWNGGEVHRLTDKIVHLKRGHIFNLENRSFFVMGGCKSSAKWKEMGLWYEQEVPTAEEIDFGVQSLANKGNHVDFILTHKYEKNNNSQPGTLEWLTDYIDKNVEFSHWYSGHWHCQALNKRHSTVYNCLIKL